MPRSKNKAPDLKHQGCSANSPGSNVNTGSEQQYSLLTADQPKKGLPITSAQKPQEQYHESQHLGHEVINSKSKAGLRLGR